LHSVRANGRRTSSSSTPEKAGASADRLRTLVPGAAHLVHMPAHIDIRLGRYEAAVKQNSDAIVASEKRVERTGAGGFYAMYRAHNYHFLVYAAQFDGRYELALDTARELVRQMPTEVVDAFPEFVEGFLPTPLHVLVRFGKWNEILELPEYPEARPISRAMRRYARSIACSALGRVDESRAEIAAFEREAGRTPLDWTIGFNPAHSVYPLARKMMEGELAFRLGDHDRAFAVLREAVAMEDELLYDEPPGWLQPTRHALGALLMATGRYAQAETVYEQDLVRNPKNGWALLGLEQSRRRLGETEGLDDLVRERKRSWKRADITPTSSCYCEPGAVELSAR
jgi:tetratricopeptide (TPR) repeat protein